MNKKKKILIILVSMLLNFAIIACNFPLITRLVDPQNQASNSPTGTPNPTNTEIPPKTESPAMTQAPIQAGMEGQQTTKVYMDNGVEITLPDSFILGDVEKDLDVLMDNLDFLNQGGAEMLQGVYENYKEDILLLGYDTSSGNQQTSLMVLKNEEFAGMSLMLISTFASRFFDSQVEFEDQQRLDLDSRDVVRFILSSDNLGVQGRQLLYLFNEADFLWIIGFFTDSDQIETQLPVFDQAVTSFEIVAFD